MTDGPRSCATLAELGERLRCTDLVPSQQPLLTRLDERLARIDEAGISSVEELRARLRYSKSIPSVAARTGVDEDYLVLLRRVVRGFFPDPEPLRAFDWISPDVIAALADMGIKNSEQLRTACADEPTEFAQRAGTPSATIEELAELCDLVRVQWISSSVARALRAADYRTPAAVAAADPEVLTGALEEANEDRRFFNATIGERDIRRIIHAASYVD